jgi:pimeloyl-ACP methyl ester carboxylesterase
MACLQLAFQAPCIFGNPNSAPGALCPQITTPALIMVGGRSTGDIPGGARHMAALLPHATLVEVPGASGYAQHSAPAQCVALWKDFVAGL